MIYQLELRINYTLWLNLFDYKCYKANVCKETVTLPCTCTYSLPWSWNIQFPRPTPAWPCSSVGGAAVIKPEGREFNSHPGQNEINAHPSQSFSLSLCGPNSISGANAHMVYMGRKLALHINYTLWLNLIYH